MADLGRSVLGTYSAACETIRAALPAVTDPQAGDLIFFSGNRHAGANHIALITRVDSKTVYTVEGNTSSGPQVIDNGGNVCEKSYLKTNTNILSYARPKYDENQVDLDVVIEVGLNEVGYIEKASDEYLDYKTENAGRANYTKYGKWIGANGDFWCASFISWCFHSAYDESADYYNQSIIIAGGSSDNYETSPENGSSDDEDIIYTGQYQSNSSLVNYVNRLANGVKGTRTKQITRITIHIARKIGDIHELSALINSSNKNYNYGIDSMGTIGLFADESSWTNSSNSTSNDKKAVNIICMNSTEEPNYKISDLCYAALVKLCEDICRRNFIFKLTYTKNPKTDSITLHEEFKPESKCPGPYVRDKVIPKLIKEVNDLIGAQQNGNMTTVKARLASSQTEALKAQSTIAIKSIKPYVAFVNEDAKDINYAVLKEIGVVGVFIDAGARYNERHKQITYRISTVYNQTIAVQQVELPHGYVYTTRAKNAAEVKEEAYWFNFVVSKYPPKLGVWLRCEFDVKKEKAQELVEEWYKWFVKWGLKSKCGIKATLAQIKKIGWPKQSLYMPLWLEGELTDSVCPDEELLTPSFFNIDNIKQGVIERGFNMSQSSTESIKSTDYVTDRNELNQQRARYN